MARDFFSDPDKPDLRWQRRSQSHVDWLESSTTPSAYNFRRFLNNCLPAIPARHAWSMRERLRHQWKQTYFELQVARFLQALHLRFPTAGTRTSASSSMVTLWGGC
jgi:hypothetical protein